jgi:hypothetical protein
LVPHSTGGVEARLGSVDEELYEGFYSLTKTQSLCNKIDTFVQLPMETTVEALECFNEYMRADFLKWHIDFLMRRMEKMDIEREA